MKESSSLVQDYYPTAADCYELLNHDSRNSFFSCVNAEVDERDVSRTLLLAQGTNPSARSGYNYHICHNSAKHCVVQVEIENALLLVSLSHFTVLV